MRAEYKLIRKNYIYRIAYELLTFVIPFFTAPYISRVLEADGVGRFSFAESVTMYFVIAVTLGKSAYGTRMISAARDDKQEYSRLFYEIELTGLISFAVCAVPWLALILLSDESRLLYILLTPYLFAALLDISWFYTGLEKLGIVSGINTLIKLCGVALVFVMVKGSGDVPAYCAVSSFIWLGSALLQWLFVPKLTVSVKGMTPKPLKHMKASLLYAVPAAASAVYLLLDKTLIGLITEDPAENGYYEQAGKLLAAAKSFSFLVYNSVVTARMSYLYAEGEKEKIKKMTEKSMDFIFLAAYAAVFGLLGISHSFVPFFFGEGYAPVECLIYLMLPLIPVTAVSNCLDTHFYIPSGQRAKSNVYLIAGALLNLCLNLCLIPQFGAAGAVVASVAAEFLISCLYVHNCGAVLTLPLLLRSSIKRIAAGLVMAVAVYYAGMTEAAGIVRLIIQLSAGAASYILLLLILRDRGLLRLIGQFH